VKPAPFVAQPRTLSRLNYTHPSRRWQNRLALNFFNLHQTILPEGAQIIKPTVGFSARFFGEPSETRKRLPDNDLQTKQTTKT